MLTPRQIEQLPLAREADRRARQQRQRDAAIDALRAHAERRELHLDYAACPDTDAPHRRDMRCSVCLALMTLETPQ